MRTELKVLRKNSFLLNAQRVGIFDLVGDVAKSKSSVPKNGTRISCTMPDCLKCLGTEALPILARNHSSAVWMVYPPSVWHAEWSLKSLGSENDFFESSKGHKELNRPVYVDESQILGDLWPVLQIRGLLFTQFVYEFSRSNNFLPFARFTGKMFFVARDDRIGSSCQGSF